MKKFSIGLIFGLLLAFTLNAFATELVFQISNFELYVNGQKIETPMVIKDWVNYIPLRAVTEALGGKVDVEGYKINITMPEPEPKIIYVQPEETETEEVKATPTPTPKPKEEPKAEPTPTPTTETPKETPTSVPLVNPEPDEEETEPIPTPKPTPEPTPEPTPTPEPEPEPDMEAYERELAALTAAYEKDIAAIDNWLNNMINILYDLYNQMIQRAGSEEQQKKLLNDLDKKVQEAYQVAKNQKDERTAKYNADVAALKAKYGI